MVDNQNFNVDNNRPEFYPTAKVIADSLNTATNDRLTTMVIVTHRYIWAEILTHRSLSRNAQSSRAYPILKMIDKVIEDNVYPLHFGRNQKGMKAVEEITDIKVAKNEWDWARADAVHAAKLLNELGVHKQVVNRVLEPFSTITAIISSTEWQNFFNQRCHIDAQPEMQAIAKEMKLAYDTSTPRLTLPGVWHLPFIRDVEYDDLEECHLIKVSTGRCARVSYLTHEGVRNFLADIDLHDKLLDSIPPHYSPLEHPAIATNHPGSYANFTGWQSYRNILEKSKTV